MSGCRAPQAAYHVDSAMRGPPSPDTPSATLRCHEPPDRSTSSRSGLLRRLRASAAGPRAAARPGCSRLLTHSQGPRVGCGLPPGRPPSHACWLSAGVAGLTGHMPPVTRQDDPPGFVPTALPGFQVGAGIWAGDITLFCHAALDKRNLSKASPVHRVRKEDTSAGGGQSHGERARTGAG